MDFEAKGEIAGYASLSITRRHYGVGEFQLVIPVDAPHTGELAIDRMLIPSEEPHKALLIESLVYEEAKAEITVRGCTLDGIVKRRLAVPPPTSESTFGWDRVIGDAETVVKHFAENNLTAPPDTKRAIHNLVIAPNQNLGIQMPGQARFEALDVLLKGLAEYADMGWTIMPDIQQKQLVFDVVPGRDLTVGNPGQTHVIISLGMGNTGEMTHTLDASTLRNTAYVGGQGEDEERLILSVGDGAEGLARRETWVDGGSLDFPDELITTGQRRLSQTEVKNTIQGAMQRHGVFQYGRDFDLGDRVTLLSQTGRLDARVIEAQEVYEKGKADAISLTFGDAPVTLASVIKGIQNQIVR